MCLKNDILIIRYFISHSNDIIFLLSYYYTKSSVEIGEIGNFW